ncbi:hypothetical protein SAMD00019534_050230, partial [Acytostelium subglobosum LB1]|uniref:hypothetical protein n=1 Tax=Acytostelium subglobosum LB1 TaxID=1410327 RepID=UPI000644CBBF
MDTQRMVQSCYTRQLQYLNTMTSSSSSLVTNDWPQPISEERRLRRKLIHDPECPTQQTSSNYSTVGRMDGVTSPTGPHEQFKKLLGEELYCYMKAIEHLFLSDELYVSPLIHNDMTFFRLLRVLRSDEWKDLYNKDKSVLRLNVYKYILGQN